jgi:hypothetical protein
MVRASVDNHPAAAAEIHPAHDGSAYRAFDVGGGIVVASHVFVEVRYSVTVDLVDMGDRCLDQGFKLADIEKKAETLVATFDEKCSFNFQVDGFEGDGTPRAGSVRIGSRDGKSVYSLEVRIVSAAAVLTDDGVRR